MPYKEHQQHSCVCVTIEPVGYPSHNHRTLLVSQGIRLVVWVDKKTDIRKTLQLSQQTLKLEFSKSLISEVWCDFFKQQALLCGCVYSKRL